MVRLRAEAFALTPILGWMAGLGYFLLAPLTLLVLHGGYTIASFFDASDLYASVDLSSGQYIIPMLVVCFAVLLSFLAIVSLKPAPKVGATKHEFFINEGKLWRVFLLTFGLALLDYVFSIWIQGGLEAFLGSHWYNRQLESVERFGDAYVLYTQLSLANQIVFTAAAALSTAHQLQLGKLNWRYSLLIICAFPLQMIMTGNRIFVALYGLSVLISCWTYARKKLIAGLLIVSPVILFIFSAWGYVRSDLTTISEEAPAYIQEDFGNRTMATLMTATEGAGVMALLHSVNDFGGKFHYFYGLSYSKAILFVVPRRFYPGKPQNFTGLIAQLYEPGMDTSLGTTQLGELYANFGVFSVLLLPLVTILILFITDRLMRNIGKYTLLSASLFLLLIWMARSSFEDNFVTFLFTLLLSKTLRLERGLCYQQPAET